MIESRLTTWGSNPGPLSVTSLRNRLRAGSSVRTATALRSVQLGTSLARAQVDESARGRDAALAPRRYVPANPFTGRFALLVETQISTFAR
jgi:hypothetical protein